LTHNHLAHARQGYFAANLVERRGVKGIEVIAADIGPGIGKPAQALENAIQTDKSLGAGLSAVARAADELEFDNRLGEGACVIARKFEARPRSLCCEVAIMGRPYPGEAISGDDAVFFQSESEFFAAMPDGLGHGPEAREASSRAVEVVAKNRGLDLHQQVSTLNQELGDTRGCAMSIVRFNKENRVLQSACFGDVYSHLYSLREAHFFASTPFILGEGNLPRPRIRIETATVETGSILVMFTDGLKSRTTLKGQLDVLRQPVVAIAQYLLENHSRPDDDALVLVARFLR
jgi:hypothetical protein